MQLTLAALFDRLCQRNNNLCDSESEKLRENYVKRVEKSITDCSTNCGIHFDVLYNLNAKSSQEFVSRFLCSKSKQKNVERSLEILEKLGESRWTEDTFNILERLAFNRCPTQTPNAIRSKSARMLLQARVRKPQLVTAVLKTLIRPLNHSNVADAELSAGIHAFCRYLMGTDAMFADFANTLQRRGQYEVNYDTLAFGGSSNSMALNVLGIFLQFLL